MEKPKGIALGNTNFDVILFCSCWFLVLGALWFLLVVVVHLMLVIWFGFVFDVFLGFTCKWCTVDYSLVVYFLLVSVFSFLVIFCSLIFSPLLCYCCFSPHQVDAPYLFLTLMCLKQNTHVYMTPFLFTQRVPWLYWH